MGRFGNYLLANIWTLIPTAVALLIFVVVKFALIIPTDCASHPLATTSTNRATGNAVFCGPQWFITDAFAAPWRSADELNKLQAKKTDPGKDTQRIAALMSAYIGTFREAKARLLWIGSFGTPIAVTLAAIVGMSWTWVVSVQDHWYDQNWGNYAIPRSYFLCLIALSAAIFVLIYMLLYELVGLTVFHDLVKWPKLFSTEFGLSLQDQLMSSVFPVLLPVGPTLIAASDVLIFITVLLVAGAVTATLYIHPTQIAATPNLTDPEYERFLTRCFQRLTVCIYLGAVLLAVCIAPIGSRYAWPASLIVAGTDASKKDVLATFTDAGAQFQVEYGLAFTLILAALFLPAWVILRRRAWQVVRAELPNASLADQEKWLTERKMDFTNYQQFGQALAILAPTGVAGTSALVSLFAH